MKLKKLLFLTAGILAFSGVVQGARVLSNWPFHAPAISDPTTILDPEIGDILYDTSSSKFRGFRGNTSTDWVDFGGTSAPNLDILSVAGTTYNVLSSNDVITADTSSADVTLNLPSAASNVGKVFYVKKVSANNKVIINADTGETIDTDSTINLISNNAIVEMFSDGSDFRIKSIRDGWRVDANISGANVSLGTSAVSSYTGIENAGLTLTNNSANGNLTAQIPCSSTNSPSGTTCSSGDESVGVVFTPPRSGYVKVCASFSHAVSVAAVVGAEIQSTFQVVRTPTNAQTISEEGKERITSRHQGANGSGNGATIAHKNCGVFDLTGGTQYAFRLFYEQTVSSPTSSNVLADASTSQGQRDIHWDVVPQ